MYSLGLVFLYDTEARGKNLYPARLKLLDIATFRGLFDQLSRAFRIKMSEQTNDDIGPAICFGNSRKFAKFNGQMRSATVQARRKFNKLAAAKLNHQPRPFGECLISRIAIDMIVIGNQSARTRLAVIALNVNEKLFRFFRLNIEWDGTKRFMFSKCTEMRVNRTRNEREFGDLVIYESGGKFWVCDGDPIADD